MFVIIVLTICTILLILFTAVQHITILALTYYMAERGIEISENDLKDSVEKVISHIIKLRR